MMNSRWQANKIGLINFWYYDEQEFPFVKGRMLLRGSNGSGKSVTMQSVVPLLLDGNMSPERLDPFGSRDRKMSSYLLEEDDGREERTGYLYLELKRQNSDTYLTIGMGIRARRGKNLDKWYFSLRADGYEPKSLEDVSVRISFCIRIQAKRLHFPKKNWKTELGMAAALSTGRLTIWSM